MARLLVIVLLAMALCAAFFGRAYAESLSLLTGENYTGEIVSPDSRGGVIRKADGSGVTERIGWTNFTQETLKLLVSQPKTKRFVELFIEPDVTEPSGRPAAPEITVKVPPRPPRPASSAGFSALFSAGLSVTLIALLYVANLYAGFEVGLFRNYSPILTTGIAAAAPVVGPLVFLCLPRKIPQSPHQLDEAAMAEEEAAIGDAVHSEAAEAARSQPAADAPVAANAQQAQVFQRGQFTFNRRFFETKFSGFLRMVPSEAERDLVLYFKSSRGEYLGSRITRITPEEVHLHVTKGGASQDVVIPFSEIAEVQIRHKEVPA